MFISAFFLVLSLVILYIAAELSLSGAEKIGRAMHLSPLAIGMLLVGFGTSLPEFFVSHIASYKGDYGIALGNIVGSNLANIFLILGVSACFVALRFQGKEAFYNLSLHLIMSLLLAIVLYFSWINIFSGLLFLILFFLFLHGVYQQAKKTRQQKKQIQTTEGASTSFSWKSSFWESGKVLLGLAGLYAGGELLTVHGSLLAKFMGVPSYIISVIFVAFGTSFPELATSLIAIYRKKDTELIMGNIIGSNLFNVCFILGTCSFYSFPLTQTYLMESLGIVGSALLLFLLYLFKSALFRFWGFVFLVAYGAFVWFWLAG